jgi:hypothetical protein
MVAMVSYWLGDICGNRGNPIHFIPGGRGMYTLGILLWVVAWTVVTFTITDKAKG